MIEVVGLTDSAGLVLGELSVFEASTVIVPWESSRFRMFHILEQDTYFFKYLVFVASSRSIAKFSKNCVWITTRRFCFFMWLLPNVKVKTLLGIWDLPTGFWFESIAAVGQLLNVEVFINEISLVALNPTKMKTVILGGTNRHEVRINSQVWEVLIRFFPLKEVDVVVLVLV